MTKPKRRIYKFIFRVAVPYSVELTPWGSELTSEIKKDLVKLILKKKNIEMTESEIDEICNPAIIYDVYGENDMDSIVFNNDVAH